jgi:hypothetical protein
MGELNPRERVRLNLDLQTEVKERLDGLQERTGAASLTEVIRRALALYDLVVDHQKAGGRIQLYNRDGTVETLTIL